MTQLRPFSSSLPSPCPSRPPPQPRSTLLPVRLPLRRCVYFCEQRLFSGNNPYSRHDYLGLCDGNLTYTKVSCIERMKTLVNSHEEEIQGDCERKICFDPLSIIPGFSWAVKICLSRCKYEIFTHNRWHIDYDCLYEWECDCPQSSGTLWRTESKTDVEKKFKRQETRTVLEDVWNSL